MSRSLSINLYLRPFSIAICGKFDSCCLYLFRHFLVYELYKSGLQIILSISDHIWAVLILEVFSREILGRVSFNS